MFVRHDGAVGSVPGCGSRLPRSRPGRDKCVEALSPHRVTAVGKLITLKVSTALSGIGRHIRLFLQLLAIAYVTICFNK